MTAKGATVVRPDLAAWRGRCEPVYERARERVRRRGGGPAPRGSRGDPEIRPDRERLRCTPKLYRPASPETRA